MGLDKQRSGPASAWCERWALAQCSMTTRVREIFQTRGVFEAAPKGLSCLSAKECRWKIKRRVVSIPTRCREISAHHARRMMDRIPLSCGKVVHGRTLEMLSSAHTVGLPILQR